MPDSPKPSDRREARASALGQLVTEAANEAANEIDQMTPIDIARLMNAEDATVAAAVQQELPEIARAMEAISDRLAHSGRLIYVGAGSSGRIGALDAYECPPTFNVSKELVISCVAGGAAEDGDDEDDADAGASDMALLAVGQLDAVVGITASGRTPYVLGALRLARSLGALIIGLACNRDTLLAELTDMMISPVVGPEVIAGSTRLKAGTAQKMVVNMLSTGSMVLLGKTYGNLMVDVQATNEKLRERAVSIVAQATGLEREKASAALEACNHETKTAILAERAHLSPELARKRLSTYGYRLRTALESTS